MLPVIALLAVGSGCANKNDANVAEQKNDKNDRFEFNNVYKICSNYSEFFNAEECNELGFSFVTGKDVKKNYKRAALCFEDACKANFALACRNAGILYRQYHNKEIDVDFTTYRAEPEEFLQKACELNDSEGCNETGLQQS